DGGLLDDARGVGERVVLRASRVALLRDRPPRARPGGGLRRAEGMEPRGSRAVARAEPRVRAGTRRGRRVGGRCAAGRGAVGRGARRGRAGRCGAGGRGTPERCARARRARGRRLRRLLEDGGVHVFDGAMGTLLYSRGVFVNVCYDALSLERPELVRAIHEEYVEAGAEILETNTFGANPVKLSAYGLEGRTEEINRAAAELARAAADGRAVVAGAIGPLGVRIEIGRAT